MILSFSAKDTQTQQRMLARHLPQGKVWENKFNTDSNLGKLLLGLASEYYRLSLLIEDVLDETDINQTNQLITEWQESVGIPCDCISSEGDLEDQRRDVLLKLTNFGGIQTAEDFVDLAALYGFSAIVSNGYGRGVFPLDFRLSFFGDLKAAVHTIIVNLAERREVFPLDFPIQFTSSVTGIVECLFRKLAPANCQLIFFYGD